MEVDDGRLAEQLRRPVLVVLALRYGQDVVQRQAGLELGHQLGTLGRIAAVRVGGGGGGSGGIVRRRTVGHIRVGGVRGGGVVGRWGVGDVDRVCISE